MRLIRFVANQDKPLWGVDHKDGSATLLEGSLESGFTRTSRRINIRKFLAPLQPTDIICIGRNYQAPLDAATDEGSRSAKRRRENDAGGADLVSSDHTLEVFLKPSISIQNPDDAIRIPHFHDLDPQVDCEGELAIIIGREARHVGEADALNHVFGYTIANDVTARAFQTLSAGGPPLWMRGKGFDTFCPIGPAIVTADELPDPHAGSGLNVRTIINGKIVREGSTNDMIRTVPQIIAALSRHMTLRAGCVILTGAPPAPPATLRTGDRVEVVIDGLGILSNSVAGG